MPKNFNLNAGDDILDSDLISFRKLLEDAESELGPLTSKNFELYEAAAENGNIGACFFLSLAHEKGIFTRRSSEEAFKWREKASLSGFPEALFALGIMYEQGDGVEKDDKKAFELHLKAAEQGHTRAEFSVASKYFFGRGVQTDYSQGAEWNLKAAMRGLVKAQEVMAMMFDQGLGVPEDKEASFLWLFRAAKNNSVSAQFALGLKYHNGETPPIPKKNKSAALNISRDAWIAKLKEAGYSDLVDSLKKRPNYEEALRWYKLAKKGGHKEAGDMIALMITLRQITWEGEEE
jgi:hypothetical protein